MPASQLKVTYEVVGRPLLTSINGVAFTGEGSEVKSHSSIDRFLVVFHSPTAMAETGLLACRSEKTGRVSGCNAGPKDFLWSGLTMKPANWRGFRAIFGEQLADSSALQTVWRRGRDSNPRYRFGQAKPRRVRTLQITKLYQRISRQRPAS
jgi:hypothetical protein